LIINFSGGDARKVSQVARGGGNGVDDWLCFAAESFQALRCRWLSVSAQGDVELVSSVKLPGAAAPLPLWDVAFPLFARKPDDNRNHRHVYEQAPGQ
jgi:hypothetical protein